MPAFDGSNVARDESYDWVTRNRDTLSRQRQEAAQRMILLPAKALRIVGLISLVVGIGSLFFFLKLPQPRADAGPIESLLFLVFVSLLLIVKPAVVSIAAHTVLQGRIHPWIWIAVVVGLIPFGSGCSIAETIVAFWLMHVFLKPGVRHALIRDDLPLPPSSL
jgi:hypothetical protein